MDYDSREENLGDGNNLIKNIIIALIKEGKIEWEIYT